MTDKLASVQAYLADNPTAPKRTISRKFDVSIYRLEKWEQEGLIKLAKVRPGGRQHNWMSNSPLGRLKK